jgi:hypothetical protein
MMACISTDTSTTTRLPLMKTASRTISTTHQNTCTKLNHPMVVPGGSD